MSGPARLGLFIYAVHSKRDADFYCAIADMTILHEREDLIVLQSADIQLLIHKIPDDIAKDITIESPPLRRENTALKFFFTVQSVEKARETANQLGGQVLPEIWDGSGFVACNALDPEGNVFQIRESI